jgi:menaquinone-dependent protoporphyrinogen oxidase
MNHKILVAYASRAESTAGVAETIGKTITQNGVQVDVIPMQNVKEITSYQAYVVGSAIQNRQWLPEALQFIQSNQADLAQKPVALFSVCMTLAMKNGERFRSDVQQWVSPARRFVRPVSEGLFTGALDISKIPTFGDRLKFRLSVLFGVWSEGDHRDWEAIKAWAEELPAKLLPG